jgi:hypothetical protein
LVFAIVFQPNHHHHPNLYNRWIDEAQICLRKLSGKSSHEVGAGPMTSSDAAKKSLIASETRGEGVVLDETVESVGLETRKHDPGSFPPRRNRPLTRRLLSVGVDFMEDEQGEREEADDPISNSESLSAAAINVQIMQIGRNKDCVFDWRRILDNQKDLGLYLQYAHARLCRLVHIELLLCTF